MFSEDHNASPFNRLPPVVVVISLAIAAVELVLQAAEHGFAGGREGIGWRLDLITNYGFFDAVLNWMLESGRYPVEHLIRFVTYLFVHGGFTHAAFTIVFTLAIGKMVAEAFSTGAFLVLYFGSGVVGALGYGVLLDTNTPLIGAYPAVYGLIGAMTFMLWIVARHTGENQLRAFSLIGFLLGIQLFFKLIFGGGDDWVADLSGFVTGFVLSIFLAPQGGVRVVSVIERLRRR